MQPLLHHMGSRESSEIAEIRVCSLNSMSSCNPVHVLYVVAAGWVSYVMTSFITCTLHQIQLTQDIMGKAEAFVEKNHLETLGLDGKKIRPTKYRK